MAELNSGWIWMRLLLQDPKRLRRISMRGGRRRTVRDITDIFACEPRPEVEASD